MERCHRVCYVLHSGCSMNFCKAVLVGVDDMTTVSETKVRRAVIVGAETVTNRAFYLNAC